MRATARGNGVSVKAYAGTTGVLVAIDVDDDRRDGLLGFALEKDGPGPGGPWWLRGMLDWEGAPPRPAGTRFLSSERPIQKFRWSDYGVDPGTRYRYTVHPVSGDWRNPTVEDGPTISVRTPGMAGRHGVLFNRAAAASQAFSRKFPDVEREMDEARQAGRQYQLPADALDWLTRGVRDSIVAFVEEATGPGWALDLAIYEFELPEIAKALEAAHRRGVRVRVVYHAEPGDPQTEENEDHLRKLPKKVKRGRRPDRLFHHKFMVLSEMDGEVRRPRAVLGGSTNFTHNGVYRQANVVHVVRRTTVARSFLELFERLFAGDDAPSTRRWIADNNDLAGDGNVVVGFTPRPDQADLALFRDVVESVQRDVLFCTAFNLDDGLEDALLGAAGDAILRLGLENGRSRITGFHRDRSAQFVTKAMLGKGLEGFLRESTRGQRGNILIHTKLVVADFTSDAPVVISGSHNLSTGASRHNDENFLVLRDADVADCYGVELMRLYDHYRFRWAASLGDGTAPPGLAKSDSWTDRYFRPDSLWWRDRVLFAGGG